MEQKIRLLIKYFCIALLVVFSAKCVDEFLPVDLAADRIADRTSESDGRFMFYTVHTENNGNFDVPAALFHAAPVGVSAEVAYSALFGEIQYLRIDVPGRNLIIGNIDAPSITQLLLDFVVIGLCILSLAVPYRFDLKAAPFFFAIIAAAIRWWFIPIQW
jgi:hypothetical protein